MGYNKQPSERRGEYCVGLAHQYQHPNGSTVSVQYYFFDDIKCKTNKRYSFGLICEKPLKKGNQPFLRVSNGVYVPNICRFPFLAFFTSIFIWNINVQLGIIL